MAPSEPYSGSFQTWPLTWLLELYEYQVSDLAAQREPRGGERNVRALRERLWQAEWPVSLRRRLIRADRQYAAWQAARRAPQGPQVLQDTAALQAVGEGPASVAQWTLPAAPIAGEAAAWAELRQLAWHADLMDEMHAVTQRLRHEPGRPTLRVLYAVTENAERAARGLPTLFPVPGAHDTLVSLGSSEVVRQLTRTLGDLLLARDTAQVWQALDRMEDNPFPPQPGDDVLRARVSAIRRGGGNPQERGQLEEALRASAGAQSEFWSDPLERPVLREAAQGIRRWLARRLEPELPAAQETQAQQPGAQHSGGALGSPTVGDSLILHLGGPERLAHWQGLRLTWRSLGPNWQLLVQGEAGEPVSGGQLALLRPDLPASERQLRLEVAEQQLQVVFSREYVLLRRRADAAQTRRLEHLAALGRACAALTLPEQQFGRLRLSRALTRRLLGDPPRSGEPHFGRSATETLATARRSLQRLAPLQKRFTPAEVAHEARVVQALLGLPPHYAAQVQQAAEQVANGSETLHDPPTRASTGRDPAPIFLSASGQFFVFSLGTDPLTLRLPGERVLTLRLDHRLELVAALPGQAAVPVGDLLVLPVHDLSVVMVREGSRVAVCALFTGSLLTGSLLTGEGP